MHRAWLRSSTYKKRYSMVKVKLLVLDVMKPIDPGTIELSKSLNELPDVHLVDITITEVERKVEAIKILIEGTDLNYEAIRKLLERHGASIHNVERVTTNKV